MSSEKSDLLRPLGLPQTKVSSKAEGKKLTQDLDMRKDFEDFMTM